MKRFTSNPIIVALIIFFLFNFFTLILTPKFIPFIGFFPGRDVALNYNLPEFMANTANFDGVHYLSIAKIGYVQYEQAFFPFYPLLIRLVGIFFNQNYLLAAIFLSNLCFLSGLWFLYQYLKLIKIDTKILKWFFIFLLVFPTSFFFSIVYNEGLFFLLLTSSLYFWKKEKYLIASILAAMSSLTRLIGIFIFIPFLIDSIFSKTKQIKKYILSFSPFIGLLIYSIYLYFATGDALFFFNSQPAFGANRSTSLILFPQVIYRYIKIFIIAAHDFKYFIAIFELVFFLFCSLILSLQLIKILKNLKKIDYPMLGLNLFSFANLVLPTLTGTFSSLPRYSLISISIFIYLAQIKNILVKILMIIIFIILHFFALAFFSQGYFVS